MKKLMTLAIVAILAFSVGACAVKKEETMKLKCPACGYEGLDFIYQP